MAAPSYRQLIPTPSPTPPWSSCAPGCSGRRRISATTSGTPRRTVWPPCSRSRTGWSSRSAGGPHNARGEHEGCGKGAADVAKLTIHTRGGPRASPAGGPASPARCPPWWSAARTRLRHRWASIGRGRPPGPLGKSVKTSSSRATGSTSTSWARRCWARTRPRTRGRRGPAAPRGRGLRLPGAVAPPWCRSCPTGASAHR
ncbi:hypothetical protein QJS66_15605 [Kocuria rhizophila]|nr:hypothetical protein QJS66_15605 [Kocuria rhizophila]